MNDLQVARRLLVMACAVIEEATNGRFAFPDPVDESYQAHAKRLDELIKIFRPGCSRRPTVELSVVDLSALNGDSWLTEMHALFERFHTSVVSLDGSSLFAIVRKRSEGRT